MNAKAERVNIRLTTDVYEPWARLAELLDISVPELLRHYMAAALSDVRGLIEMAERVNVGDDEGARNIWSTMVNVHRALQERDFAMGFAKELADRTSNTVR
jgi:hypothetical protein